MPARGERWFPGSDSRMLRQLSRLPPSWVSASRWNRHLDGVGGGPSMPDAAPNMSGLADATEVRSWSVHLSRRGLRRNRTHGVSESGSTSRPPLSQIGIDRNTTASADTIKSPCRTCCHARLLTRPSKTSWTPLPGFIPGSEGVGLKVVRGSDLELKRWPPPNPGFPGVRGRWAASSTSTHFVMSRRGTNVVQRGGNPTNPPLRGGNNSLPIAPAGDSEFAAFDYQDVPEESDA